MKATELDHALEHVRQRQVRKVDVVLSDGQRHPQGAQDGSRAHVPEQDALRVAGGARGVAERVDVLGVGRVVDLGVGLALGLNLREGQGLESHGLGLALLLAGQWLHLYHAVQRGALRLASDDVGHNLCGAQERLHGCLVDNVGHGVRGERVVHGDGHYRLCVAALLCDAPLRAVLGVEPEDAPVPELRILGRLAEAEAEKARAKVVRALADFLVGAPDEWACDAIGAEWPVAQTRLGAILAAGVLEVLVGRHHRLARRTVVHRQVHLEAARAAMNRTPAIVRIF
mmetsp:Transcript_111454/g.296165  ORF Transcript_111454/g.296165 Transcript_111454/m.296165 type:complete len:285 (-) Transcript_111454:76-930(-)